MILIVGIDSYPFRVEELQDKDCLRVTTFAAARTVIAALVKSDDVELDYIRIGALRGEAWETNPFDFIDWLVGLQQTTGRKFRVRNAWPEASERWDLDKYIREKGLMLIF